MLICSDIWNRCVCGIRMVVWLQKFNQTLAIRELADSGDKYKNICMKYTGCTVDDWIFQIVLVLFYISRIV
jgi:hypothetical protein